MPIRPLISRVLVRRVGDVFGRSDENTCPARRVVIPANAEATTRLMAAAFRAVGMQAELTPPSDGQTLELGARYTGGDECFPAKVTVGGFMKVLAEPGCDPSRVMFFMPTADGPCRFGQYAPYLRTLLDRHGYGAVGILSPTSQDGYAELGEVAGPFLRTGWRATVAGGILHKLLLRTRPYEVHPGDSDRAYEEGLAELAAVVERAPVAPGPQMRSLQAALRSCRERFRAVPVRRDPDKLLIGIVGEIFCRLDCFSNQDLVRRLEAHGAEAWLSDFCEWMWYAKAEELRVLRLRGRHWTPGYAAAWLHARVQRRDEEALFAVCEEDFRGREEPPIEEVLDAARPYLPPEGAVGEMVPNVGKVVCFARRGVHGVLDISPFTCMNGIVSEAVYPKLSADLGGLPIRNLYFDGSTEASELDLGVFVEMARRRRRD